MQHVKITQGAHAKFFVGKILETTYTQVNSAGTGGTSMYFLPVPDTRIPPPVSPVHGTVAGTPERLIIVFGRQT